MAKRAQRTEPMSEQEWQALPITFGAADAARVLGCCTRYAQAHAEDFGGHLIGGRWIFSKPTIGALVGLRS